MYKHYETIRTVAKIDAQNCPGGYTLAPEGELCISENDSQRLQENAQAQFPIVDGMSEEERQRNAVVHPVYTALLFKHLLPDGTETKESCEQQDAYLTGNSHCVCKIGYTRDQGQCRKRD